MADNNRNFESELWRPKVQNQGTCSATVLLKAVGESFLSSSRLLLVAASGMGIPWLTSPSFQLCVCRQMAFWGWGGGLASFCKDVIHIGLRPSPLWYGLTSCWQITFAMTLFPHKVTF